jgi:hypothetical protein
MRVALVTDSSLLFLFVGRHIPSGWRSDGELRAAIRRGSVATPLSWEMNPLDRKLCVLAFRRVCPWNDPIIRRVQG